MRCSDGADWLKMEMDNDTEIEYWLRAAEREERAGHIATAITFKNMAWLVGHQQLWLDWIKAQDNEKPN